MTRGDGHALDLLDGDGGPAAAALGWTRAPRLRCNLPRGSRRAKRWNSWVVHDRRFLFAAGVADLGRVWRGHAVMVDLAAKVVVSRAATSLRPRAGALGDTEDAPARFQSRRLTFSSTHDRDTTSLLVTCERFDEGERLSAAMRVAYPPGAEVSCLASPLAGGGLHYSSRHLALPAAGHVRVGAREYAFEGPQALATLDYGRGLWPRRAAWTWASASGWCGDELVGISLARGGSEASATADDVVAIDGRLFRIDAGLEWTRGAADAGPWTVRSASGDVDLAFQPLVRRAEGFDALLIHSGLDAWLGTWSGRIRTDGGRGLAIDALPGWIEEHRRLW